MRLTLIFLICCFVLALQAQTFDKFIERGDQLYDEKKYIESAKEYDKAFELTEGSAHQYYNAACSWALSGDTLKSINYLHLSADKGWKNLKHIKRDKDLLSLHSVRA